MPTRRQVLQAGAIAPLATIAACSSGGDAPVSDADDSISSQVTASEDDLIKRYDVTIAAFPTLAAKLTPIRDQHNEHLAAVGGDSAPTDLKGVVIPPTAQAALKELVVAEREAARERRASCVQASGSELIWDLALIATSESQHVASLTDGSP